MQSSKNELVGGLRSKGSFLALFDTVASKLKKNQVFFFILLGDFCELEEFADISDRIVMK